MDNAYLKQQIIIVGAGPAGLMAAERLSDAGLKPVIYDAMPTPARKFLMAGKSGLNITHSESVERLLTRYGSREAELSRAVEGFTPTAIRGWGATLGVETFVGSSGRVFPKEFKASPLLRAWLARLGERGVELITRHRWQGWAEDGNHVFAGPSGTMPVGAEATLFALGGPCWTRLGSDGAWVPAFQQKGIAVSPFRPANCGFDVNWSDHFLERFEGQPVKNSLLSFGGQTIKGDFVITRSGVEGSAIYSLSSGIRDRIERDGPTDLVLDLCPDRNTPQLSQALGKPRGKKSVATHLKRSTGLAGVKAGLLRECLPKDTFEDPQKLAAAIKKVSVTLRRPRPIDEAISTAGGVSFEALNNHLMLKDMPGTFCAGEMIDWEAPTGGYLLTACLAQGRQSADGILKWLSDSRGSAD